MEQLQQNTPVAFQRGATMGTTLAYMGSLVTLLAKSEETGGGCALVESWGRPGNEPPPMIHERENELCYILEGTMEFYVDNQVLTANAGEVIFIPQGKPHAFYIKSPTVRVIFLAQATGSQPVGLDRFFSEMSQPAESLDLPPAGTTQSIDRDRAIAVARENGTRLLSPAETAQLLPHYPGFRANLTKADKS